MSLIHPGFKQGDGPSLPDSSALPEDVMSYLPYPAPLLAASSEEKNASALRKIIDDAMQQGVQLQSLEAGDHGGLLVQHPEQV